MLAKAWPLKGCYGDDDDKIMQVAHTWWHVQCPMNPWVCAELLQSRPALCDPMDRRLPSFSVLGILQARILRVGCHALLQGIVWTQGSNPCLTSPAVAGGFFSTNATWEAQPVNISSQIPFSSLRREIGSLVPLYLVHKHTFQFCRLWDL